MNRKDFIKNTSFGFAGLIIGTNLISSQNEKPPPIEKEMVNEFVRVAHFDLNKVKELFDENPSLLHSAWDWGGGDFETAVGAAGHMGNKEIVNFFLGKGARMNLFVAAMMGKLNIVKAIIESFPEQINSKGPHGLSLIHHAEKGGEEALPVLDYLKSKKA